MEQRILDHDPNLSGSTTESAPDPPARSSPVDDLPLQRTTFVGRACDLAIAGELMVSSRMLALTGAPGSGKTRMALRLAATHAGHLPDGMAFVSLSAVTEPRGLEPVILAALDPAD